jgi:hypothetical protein
MTWREYLWREATNVVNLLLVAFLALTIWAALWFTPTLIDKLSQWYQRIECVEDATSWKTLGDVIRGRNPCM